MDLEKIIPKDGPSIEEVERYVKKYSNELIVIKCGGSVLLDENLFNQFIEDISVTSTPMSAIDFAVPPVETILILCSLSD